MTTAQHEISAALGLAESEARIEAQILLQTALDANRAWLMAHANDELDETAKTRFDAMLARRLAGEPIAYILGRREFYGLNLDVTPATLIPRPDTETLVETALAKIPERLPCRVLDLGTGSGAIALTVAAQRPHAAITAVDSSPSALQVAARNAKKLKLDNIRFIESDWFSALPDAKFDVIASNPPYIAESDAHLQQGDLRFEPESALIAGMDGLDCIRSIVADADKYLNADGWLLLEHGYDQAEQVRALLQQAGFINTTSVHDLAGIPRVSLAQLLAR